VTKAPFGVTVLSSTIESHSGTPSFGANFSFASPCEFQPGCVITSSTRLIISFAAPIEGFASYAPHIIGNGGMFIDGQQLLPGPAYNGFFGVVGPFTTLDIQSAPGFTDSDLSVYFSSNVIAEASTVSEPSSLLLLGAGMVGSAVLKSRRRSAKQE
jgi:hypothetical protein